jgi:DNA polymerase III epsilon subunit family exonuclease
MAEHVDDVDFVVVDVETTGLSPNAGDRVCEIGAVKLRGSAVVDSFGTLVDPQRPVSAGAYAVNGISPAMLAGAPAFAAIAGTFSEFIHGAVLVAYNAPFDLSFLRSEFLLSGSSAPANTVVDALALARQLLTGLGRYPQENVARVMGISFPVKHRALEDAMVTARLFAMFSSMLKAYDCPTVADLLRRDLTAVLNAKRLSIVNDALDQKTNLWIKYLSPTNAEITDRVVSPKECVETRQGKDQAMYLIGYCHSARGERNFRVDRILDARIVRPSIV